MSRQRAESHTAGLTQQLLHQLGQDHINLDAIRQLATAAGKRRLLPLLGQIATGALPDETSYHQANAIYTLGMMRDPAAVPWLAPLLDVPDPDVQVLAVRALGRIGGEEALEPVRRRYNRPAEPSPTPEA